jgi:F0F1-type ATP synthase assembly protein I
MNHAEKYFNAERAECLFGLFLSAVSVGLSGYFFTIDKSFFRGLAWVFIVFAIIQFIVSIIIVIRSPKDIARVNQFLQTEKSRISSEEIPRMVTVLRNFVVYRYAEIVFIILGLVLYFFQSQDMWQGVGLGLIIQAGVLLVFDFFAEKRGKVYLSFLKTQI